MATYGGYCAFAERCGGGVPLVRTIHEALNQARGTAFDVSEWSPAWIENLAIARALAEVWETNQRLANQWDPQRVSTVLERWEEILRFHPHDRVAKVERRARIAGHFARFGAALTHQYDADRLRKLLGLTFVKVVNFDPTNAIRSWPGMPGAAPTTPWYSSIAHLLVQTAKPDAWTDGEFYAVVDRMAIDMDGHVPAWVTLDWYRNGPRPGGSATPSLDPDAGFYLDDDFNLDNEIFDQ